MPKDTAHKLVAREAFGFWTRTKLAPYRAVRFDPARQEDGRVSYRGRAWVEVLEHGVDREPERFLTADVETVGPHEWLHYYPHVDEPVCGWGRPRLPDGGMQYCPRKREASEPFCPKHTAELNEERNLSDDHEHGAGGEPVPVAPAGSGDAGHSGDGV